MNSYRVTFDYILFEEDEHHIGRTTIPITSEDAYHATKEAHCMFYNANKANCASGNLEILRIDTWRVRN